MLTGGQLAGLIVAVFWAVLVAFIALTLLKLSRLLGEVSKVVREIGDQAAPAGRHGRHGQARQRAARPHRRHHQAGHGVTQNVSAVTTVMSSVVGGPLVKAAAFSYGVRKALKNGDGDAREASARPQLQALLGKGRR